MQKLIFWGQGWEQQISKNTEDTLNPLPYPPKNTIFQLLVSWSELFIFLKNY